APPGRPVPGCAAAATVVAAGVLPVRPRDPGGDRQQGGYPGVPAGGGLTVHIAMATAAGDSGMNEDWAGRRPGAAVVRDGVSAPVETGCRHGTRWYVAQLGSRLLAHLATEGQPLRDVLAAAISETSLVHASTCDLSHPGTPAAAVA